MRSDFDFRWIFCVHVLICLAGNFFTGPAAISAAEIVELSAETWDEFAPSGKEVDAIYGDFVLRNDQLVAVIARPAATRNANMTVRGVGGAIIDLTRRERPNDQLSAFYPEASRVAFHSAERVRVIVDGETATLPPNRPLAGKTVKLVCPAVATDNPAVVVEYELGDGQPFLTVRTNYENGTSQPQTIELSDAIRADRTFAFGDDAATGLFWAYDEWFGQAYGVVAEGFDIRRGGGRGPSLQYFRNSKTGESIPANGRFVLERKIFPAADLLQAKAIAATLAGVSTKPIELLVHDSLGPVEHAKVTVRAGDKVYGSARTPADGKLSFALPDGKYEVAIEALGRPAKSIEVDTALAIDLATVPRYEIELEPCGYVLAEITDENGDPIPCKVAFQGREETETPNFGPDSAAVAVGNLHYSHDGRFRQEIGPGQYDVIISRGPEYDAVFTKIEVERGKDSPLRATLKRTVDTAGWISAEFHSHSSPSGDNTSDQLGRVLNLLAEHIEFAPCTEHNRIDSYTPHLKRLDAESLMATCTGMELTGSPLPVNHQNAFPLVHRPRTQDGGAPVTDANPLVQIERLALWDSASEKLVQGNHPNLVQILADKDEDGTYDGGFEGMFAFMDAIEVHPPIGIFTPPESTPSGRLARNPIFHWMQMLNMGYRITGVVNTDAHYNEHGSGWLRNYIKSPTDDPAEIDTMEIVRASERGNIVVSNGPFLEVGLVTMHDGLPHIAGPGDDATAVGGKTSLQVRVQCANWLDVNRVQVFLNGRPAEQWNFTRRTHPDSFGNGVVKFQRAIPLRLATDTHVIVAAVGEGWKLGPVMGEQRGQQAPVAVSNPIFVDIDGDGFTANGDRLGVAIPLPLK